jgi:hypothetical protein
MFEEFKRSTRGRSRPSLQCTGLEKRQKGAKITNLTCGGMRASKRIVARGRRGEGARKGWG